jgi:ribosomal protein S18 acetylase RimI-like enzyme
MNPAYTIRQAEPKDLDQLIDLCEAHAEYENSAYTRDGKAEKLAKHLFSDSTGLVCYVAVSGDKLLGYISFIKQFSTWSAAHYVYMDCLYLLPEARNFGIGKALMDKTIAYAKAENCVEVQWQTPSTNVDAIRFYERTAAHTKSKVRFFLGVK